MSGKIQNLNEGSSQALQALLSSIAPGAGTDTADAVKKLTEKLGELVGEDAMKELNQGRNERGELVNEDGLPIIEISEPLTSASERGTGNSLLAEEEQLIPIESLPHPVRERWKAERDRILDFLEEEERVEQMQEEQADVEEREAILRKRREAAAKEKDKMKASKEMQKKMGKALLRDMAENRLREDIARPITDLAEKKDKARRKASKVVSFAVESEDEEPPSGASNVSKPTLDWGDVTPARLQSTSVKPLLRSSNTLPMKMKVVERQPTNQPKISIPMNADSDDESDPETSNSISLGSRPDDDQGYVYSPAESESEGELVLEEEEFDVGFAQHQREIALQYYEKRSRIGEEALVAMSSHSHSADRNDIPLDMPSPEPQPKPSISQFRANRIASSYSASSPSSSSVSLGSSVLPASTARTIQKAVRTGKLDADGRLVGGELDSASEDEADGMSEVLELLKKGEVYNLGPDGNYIHTIPQKSTDVRAQAPSSTSIPSSNKETNSLTALNRPKTSRFKLDRSQAGRPALHASPSPSTQDSKPGTSISSTQRSASKTAVSSVMERRLPAMGVPPAGSSASQISVVSSTTNLPFAVPRSTTNGTPRAASATMPSMVVESPSFAKSSSRMPSMIVESPSFEKLPTTISSPSFLPPTPNRSVSRPTRPPAVLSASVLEASKAPSSSAKVSIPEPRKKVSRFMADRM